MRNNHPETPQRFVMRNSRPTKHKSLVASALK